MSRIKQAIHMLPRDRQPLREVRWAHLLLNQFVKKQNFSRNARRKFDEPLAALRSGRHGNRAILLEVEIKGGFKSIDSVTECLFFGIAACDSFRDVWKSYGASVRFAENLHWILHRVSFT